MGKCTCVFEHLRLYAFLCGQNLHLYILPLKLTLGVHCLTGLVLMFQLTFHLFYLQRAIKSDTSKVPLLIDFRLDIGCLLFVVSGQFQRMFHKSVMHIK